MQKSFRVFAALALIGLIWACWSFLFPSPEQVIRSRLHKLARIASIPPRTGTVGWAYHIQEALDYVTPDVVVDLDIRGYDPLTISGRDELGQAALAGISGRGRTIEFLDMSVTLGADKESAVANLTLKSSEGGQPDFFVNEFDFMLKKVNGKWLICHVRSVKTFSTLNPRHAPFSFGDLRPLV